MTERVAYIVPVVPHGFVPVDPERNPVRYGLDDANGNPIIIRSSAAWATPTDAWNAGTAAGYIVHD